MDSPRRHRQRGGWALYRSALCLAISIVIAFASSSWMLGTIAPLQAQADEVKTVTEVLGVDRGELVAWLESHEHDDYYLTTPYKPYDWRSPNGDINKYGANSDGKTAGMNCTGFIWHALCAAHGWKNDIANRVPGMNGWGTLIQNENLQTYTFEDKKSMLESGKLKKGDIIWMWADKDPHKVSDFHHVAIFWGDTPSDDRMWHSSGDAANNWKGSNKITPIEGKTASVLYQVVKVKDSPGGFSVNKKSSQPDLTDGNDHYRLEGAVYGIFTSKEAAKTHESGKALKTYKTDADGTFTSEKEFAPGTYFVAETTPPHGYKLDENTYEIEIKDAKITPVNNGTVTDIPLLGGFKLAKRSANPLITDGNASYTLAGARYGIFKTRADAATHDAAKAIGVRETTADGTLETGFEWPEGSYFVAEVGASPGYAIDGNVYEVAIKPEELTTVNAGVGFSPEAPVTNPVALWAAKQDAETADGKAQGSATLEGAQFEIAYYDGYYDLSSLPATATRTWTVETDADGQARVSDDLKVSGDEFYRLPDGRVTIPLGTITVQETQPPSGYLLGNGQDEMGEKRVVQVTSDNSGEEIGVYAAPTVPDQVERGGVMVGKVDRQNTQSRAEGGASLQGTVFEITSDNDQQVMVDGTRFSKGDVVGSMVAKLADDGRVIAQTPANYLPVGTYTVKEAQAGEGYLLDNASKQWSQTFEITENGQMVDLTDSEHRASNQVMRGDFKFLKADGQSKEHLGFIPFMVTSRTTGERHVIMTNAEGKVSTASSWNSHGHHTNGNDAAVTQADGAEGGFTVDTSKLDPAAGTWFSGNANASVDPNDNLGALPYDTYTVSELRVMANSGYELTSFSVSISQDGQEIDLGTINDNPGPSIGTTLVDGADGDHGATADEAITLIDTVAFRGLMPGNTYTLAGTLHVRNADGTDAGPALDSQGNPIAASQTFTPSTAEGEIAVVFACAAPNLAGNTVVAFEDLIRNEQIYATHSDITDEGQTVRFAPPHEEEGQPATTAEDEGDKGEDKSPDEEAPSDDQAPTAQDETPEKGSLPRTGDELGIMPIALLAIAAAAFAAAAFYLRRLPRDREVAVDRGPDNSDSE